MAMTECHGQVIALNDAQLGNWQRAAWSCSEHLSPQALSLLPPDLRPPNTATHSSRPFRSWFVYLSQFTSTHAVHCEPSFMPAPQNHNVHNAVAPRVHCRFPEVIFGCACFCLHRRHHSSFVAGLRTVEPRKFHPYTHDAGTHKHDHVRKKQCAVHGFAGQQPPYLTPLSTA